MADIKYFDEDDYKRLNSKLINNAYQRNKIGIVVKGSVWWMEECDDNRVYDSVIKRMKLYYPSLTYLYDLH